jgi:hypothetical protein
VRRPRSEDDRVPQSGVHGAVLLRRCADKAGPTSGLNAVITRGEGPGWWDRGTVLTSLAVSIALGSTSMSDIDLLTHQAGRVPVAAGRR